MRNECTSMNAERNNTKHNKTKKKIIIRQTNVWCFPKRRMKYQEIKKTACSRVFGYVQFLSIRSICCICICSCVLTFLFVQYHFLLHSLHLNSSAK